MAKALAHRRQLPLRQRGLAQVNKVVGIVDAKGGVIRLALGRAPVPLDRRLDVALEVGSQVEVAARKKPITFLQPRGALPFWDLLRQKATLLPD